MPYLPQAYAQRFSCRRCCAVAGGSHHHRGIRRTRSSRGCRLRTPRRRLPSRRDLQRVRPARQPSRNRQCGHHGRFLLLPLRRRRSQTPPRCVTPRSSVRAPAAVAQQRSRPACGRVLGLGAGHARPGQRASRSVTDLHGSSGPVAKELSADGEVVRGRRWNSGGATLTVGGWRGVGARGRQHEADDGGSVWELGPVGEDNGVA
ncbi:hypothetical protein GUJ93_ZPchr0013g34645 [Zizania palustris]|uniref:Uncharacterized protein n=1 Tax=Zizania palustris TaxID=103762 RepID=A0A8J5WVZ6_ZIZPA|nr:hypothetical protein GUJ93_ZPchr0013g34645 [Zizania palustris]